MESLREDESGILKNGKTKPMVFRRFTYENGLDIIAPLKCGTRWLEEWTNPIDIQTYGKIEELIPTPKTYWVYRSPDEHLISALHTEIRANVNINGLSQQSSIESVVESFLRGEGAHWSPTLFADMYPIHKRIKFKLIPLSNLSTLFSLELKYSPDWYYDVSKWDKDDIMDMIGKNTLYTLLRTINTEIEWLNTINRDMKKFL